MNNKCHFLQRGIAHLSLAIIIAGLVTVGTFFSNKIGTLFNHANSAPVATVQTQNQASVTTAQPSAKAAAVSKNPAAAPLVKDCGTDMSCFMAQLSTCGPASIEFSDTINWFNAGNITTTSNIVVGKSATPNACSFKQRTDKITARRLNSKGVEVGPSESETGGVGIITACPAVPATKLVELFTQWNKGNFDSSDLDGYNCKATLPKAMTDAMAQQANTPTPDPFADANNPHQTYDGLAANVSSVGTNDYQFNVSEVTSNTITLQMRGSDANAAPIPVTLTMNVPQTYFGHTFTLTSTKNEYGDYIGTVTTDKVQ